MIFCQASSSCDGTVRIWKTDDNELVHTITDSLEKSETTDNYLCRLSWHPTGRYLAVPGHNNGIFKEFSQNFVSIFFIFLVDIKIFERDTWKSSITLKNGHSKVTEFSMKFL